MKIIHGSLSGLLAEVKAHANTDRIRVAALMQSAVEATRAPLYASWIVVTTRLDGNRWIEWRLPVGRQLAEVTEHGFTVPAKLTKHTEQRLADVRARIEAAGLAMADGIVADDAETADGVLG